MKKRMEIKETKALSVQKTSILPLISLIKLGVEIHGEPSAQRESTAPSFDVKEPVSYTLSDLLSLHTIDNGVEHRWHHHVKVGQQDMNMSRNVMSKAVGQQGKEGWNIKHEDDTEVGATGAEGLVPGILGGQMKHRSEDQ